MGALQHQSLCGDGPGLPTVMTDAGHRAGTPGPPQAGWEKIHPMAPRLVLWSRLFSQYVWRAHMGLAPGRGGMGTHHSLLALWPCYLFIIETLIHISPTMMGRNKALP